MRYLALCTDYDGTIATHGIVDEPTIDALTRLRESGRKLIMVTGREIGELISVFPRLDLVDRRRGAPCVYNSAGRRPAIGSRLRNPRAFVNLRPELRFFPATVVLR